MYNNNLIELSSEGYKIIENELLIPFLDRIFIIAACKDDIDNLIKNVYKPVVEEELGYKLIFQEKNEPKNTIYEDIWENIEKCRLIICDLTHQRPNCYIEYGYAHALKKKIILCVKESEGKDENGNLRMPFDVMPQKFSFWKDENDEESLKAFRADIKNRIEDSVLILESKSEI